uniref:Uncharacterized protein n=1 Tax=Ciona savignyi TaxID=51511 RepID=H2YGP4_CIOSA
MLSVEAKQRLSNLITPAFAVKPHKSKSTAHGVDKGKVTSQRRRKDKSNSEKLVEYDGTAPPPTGDELVKINLPKSRWEESDEDNKRDDNASGDVGNKTRKIRIKRKPHHDEQVKSVDEFESSKSSDARMVITLSKQDENIKTRKVSIAGNKDSSAGGDDDRSQDKSMKSSTVSSRDAQDCYPDQDALDLEPLSGFSNTESLSDKADKKKKK